MLHACFTPIHMCFVYTSLHFSMISGTNLLTRCNSASSLCFCCFCFSEKLYRKYSRNWTKQKPKSIFYRNEDEVRRGTKRRTRAPTPALGAAKPGPAPRHGVAPQAPNRPQSFAYLYIFSGKPWIPEPPSTKSSVAAAIAEPISGGSEALPGTLPKGEIIAGGIYIAMPASEVMRE